MLRYLEPEVAGQLGKQTIRENYNHPPKINILNYEFYGWLGDDILESFPCYIVTERLASKIKQENLTGVNLTDVIITLSDEFLEFFDPKILPNFFWAQIIGKGPEDDFHIGPDLRLIISEKAFSLLSQFNVQNALFEGV